MLIRRKFLNGTFAAGLALTTRGAQPAAAQPAQPRRIIVEFADPHVESEHAGSALGAGFPAANSGTDDHRAGGADDRRGRRRPRGDRSAEPGGGAGRLWSGSGAPIPRPLRHHGAHHPRRSGRGAPPAGVAGAAGRARHPAQYRRAASQMAHRWNRGLALAGGREGRHSDHVSHYRPAAAVRPDRRASPAARPHHRSHGRFIGRHEEQHDAGHDRARPPRSRYIRMCR